MAEGTFRLRVTYGKTERLRFLSHLEVTRACERSVRRAQLEYAVTQGFSPRMKIAFGPALPVGTAGLAESYDVWLTRFVPSAQVLTRLRESTPEGLAPVSVGYVPEKAPSLSAGQALCEYQVLVKGPGVGPEAVRAGLEALVAEGSLELEQKKGKTKVYDLAVSIPKEPAVREILGGAGIEMTTRIGEWGSLRPEAFIASALRRASVDGAVITVIRTGLHTDGKDA